MPETNNSSSSIQEYDVLIIGAEPVGLATAIASRKQGIHKTI